MDAWAWIVIAVVVVLILAAVAWFVMRQRSRKQLHSRFGPEYDRTVERAGGRRAAEAELGERARERDRLEIRPLPAEARERYSSEWTRIQTQFVDRPDDAVGEADRLVTQVMRDRGYPVDDFERQAALVSVDHPDVVENYRSAHSIHARNEQRLASTDDLRQALLHYRALFDELLGNDQSKNDQSNREGSSRRESA
jgi:hypothetical protein